MDANRELRAENRRHAQYGAELRAKLKLAKSLLVEMETERRRRRQLLTENGAANAHPRVTDDDKLEANTHRASNGRVSGGGVGDLEGGDERNSRRCLSAIADDDEEDGGDDCDRRQQNAKSNEMDALLRCE